VAGTDVAQLYIHDKVASVLQPVRKLSGFQRITLAPGQTRTVRFTLGRDQLGYYDNNARFVVEPGAFDVWVGDSSDATLHGDLTVR
jgi:beta-glucosidase